MEWVRVCNANSLSNGELISFDNSNKKMLIAKVQNKIYATDGICTHEYVDLSTYVQVLSLLKHMIFLVIQPIYSHADVYKRVYTNYEY
jgi:Rieske 2Fe-2S protein